MGNKASPASGTGTAPPSGVRWGTLTAGEQEIALENLERWMSQVFVRFVKNYDDCHGDGTLNPEHQRHAVGTARAYVALVLRERDPDLGRVFLWCAAVLNLVVCFNSEYADCMPCATWAHLMRHEYSTREIFWATVDVVRFHSGQRDFSFLPGDDGIFADA